MQYKISPFVKLFDSREYIALYNFLNSKMLICFSECEINKLKLIQNGIDVELDEFVNRLIIGDFITGSYNSPEKLIELVYDKQNYWFMGKLYLWK